MLLEKIKGPEDVKKMNLDELNKLSEEIREYIVDVVSERGGHLAPNLGVVELTIALHYVFNSPEDKFVFDVGHQGYVHKILTGRWKELKNLRTKNGPAGYLSRVESIHDVFGAGHTSTSLSAAFGFAIANKLKNKKNKVIAIIGDGALTAGMAFEALNNISFYNADVLIIVNYNGKSISDNVGGLAKHFSEIAEKGVTPNLFESLGFSFEGIVDGHNLEELIKKLEEQKSKNYPRVLFVKTIKGKGYIFAEKNPTKFHSPSPFYKDTGEFKSKGIKYSDIFSKSLIYLAEKYDDIVAITAAMPTGTKLSLFQERFPERFFDVGIAEQNAVTFAAGLAADGLKPYFAVYSTFLQRAYDQIVHDVAIQNLNVVFAIDRAGFVGGDGYTHHGAFDVSYLRHIPNFVLMAPKDEEELKDMVYTAYNYRKGPIALRYPRQRAKEIEIKDFREIPIGKAEIIDRGDDLVIITYGHAYNIGKEVKELLEKDYSVGLINARFAKPIPENLIKEIDAVGLAVTIEENALIGGFGSAILEELSNREIPSKVIRYGIKDEFIPHGTIEEQRELTNLNARQIYEDLVKKLRK